METVFVFPEAAMTADAVTGWAPVVPGRWNSPAGPPSPEEEAAYREWLTAHREAHNAAWDRLLPTVDPSDELLPDDRGTFEVDGPLDIGDPCWGPTVRAELPAGTYNVTAWGHEGTVARFGLYRRA